MKKTKTFLAILALTAVTLTPGALAFADNSAAASQPTDVSITATSVGNSPDASLSVGTATATTDTPTIETIPDMTTELTLLQAKLKNGNLGFFAKFWLRLKINEIENQINVQNAVQQ